MAEVPRGATPDTINIDLQKNIYVGVRGMWVKYRKGDKKGVIIVSDEKSGPLRAKKPIKPKTYGDTDLWLMQIEYMWRLQR
ncbi:MAG TPA: hypothetical protein ENI11_01265 [Actinobacteria bacterium]|nr:hypothetical protein [Actinomycetota bacterium]